MIVGNVKDLDGKKLENDLVKNVNMKVLVSPENGWDDYVMRVFDLDKDGYSPKHKHDWPHINYVISGKGNLMIDNIDYEISEGSYAYVPANTIHQFKNVGDHKLSFICIVPNKGHQ